ncbi:MAG: VanZ family protein, partial [Candidatus Binatia bacterium]
AWTPSSTSMACHGCGDGRRVLRWLLLAAYVGLIFSTIPYVRAWSAALLGAGWGRWWIGGAGIAFGAAATVVAAVAVRRRGGAVRRRVVVPIGCALAYGTLVWYLSAVPDEVVHVAEYGLLAILFWWALEAGERPRAAWAVALTGLVGLADELVQGATPGRFFDWRDVAGNLVAGALPVWLVTAVRRDAMESDAT